MSDSEHDDGVYDRTPEGQERLRMRAARWEELARTLLEERGIARRLTPTLYCCEMAAKGRLITLEQ